MPFLASRLWCARGHAGEVQRLRRGAQSSFIFLYASVIHAALMATLALKMQVSSQIQQRQETKQVFDALDSNHDEEPRCTPTEPQNPAL